MQAVLSCQWGLFIQYVFRCYLLSNLLFIPMVSCHTFILVIISSVSLKMSCIGVPGRVSPLSAQLLISAQVTISRFVGRGPRAGPALTARSLLGILSRSLSLCPFPALSLSLSEKNTSYIADPLVALDRRVEGSLSSRGGMFDHC